MNVTFQTGKFIIKEIIEITLDLMDSEEEGRRRPEMIANYFDFSELGLYIYILEIELDFQKTIGSWNPRDKSLEWESKEM